MLKRLKDFLWKEDKTRTVHAGLFGTVMFGGLFVLNLFFKRDWKEIAAYGYACWQSCWMLAKVYYADHPEPKE